MTSSPALPPPTDPAFSLTQLSLLFLLAGSPLSQCLILCYLAGTNAGQAGRGSEEQDFR